jgi:hypothetical protein
MKPNLQRVAPPLLLLVAALSLTGCELVGDIFKAGLWVGILAVVGLVVVIGGAIALVKR